VEQSSALLRKSFAVNVALKTLPEQNFVAAAAQE